MLTGLRALDTNRPPGEHNLVEWARPYLSGKKRLKKVMDPGLGNQYPIKGALQAAVLITKCLESDPKSRPSTAEILETLETIDAIKEKPSSSKGSSRSSPDTRHHRNKKSPIHPRHAANGLSLPRPHRP